jgi:hypothetical protein
MTERAQVLMLQIVGALVVFGVVVVAAILAPRYPIPATLVSTLVTGLIAKLFGQPVAAVTIEAAGHLEPEQAAQVAQRAIASLPPDARQQLQPATVVLTGLSSKPPPLE